MDQKKIGTFLKELRKEKGITQEKLAEQLHVSARSVSRWETGNNMPDIALLVDIADFYGVDVREIIEGERKSEMMNKDIREVASKMADYADTEKGKLFTWIRVISLIGTVFLTVAIALQCIFYEPNIFRLMAIALSFLGLVAMALTALYANGVLDRLVKKKGFTIAVWVAVIVLIAISLKFILITALLAGIGMCDFAMPYQNESGIENYDKESLIQEYESDLDSALFVFPDDTSSAISATYESSLKTGLFDTDGDIFLIATYSDEDFEKEMERLSDITCTVFETDKKDSDYHTTEIVYDTETYNYPAYVAIDGYDDVYEYALIDDSENRIIYVLLSYPNGIIDRLLLIGKGDYLKKNRLEYNTGFKSTLDRFSIYSFSFTKDMWCEYTPADEGRPLLGEAR